MTTKQNKSTMLFKAVSIIAILWNLLGVMAYLGQVYTTPEMLSAMPKADQNYFNNMPAWVTGAFAIAVFAGFLASILLLLKKKISISLFAISLAAIIAQDIYSFFIQNYISVTSTRIFMPIIVLIISIFLLRFSKKSLG